MTSGSYFQMLLADSDYGDGQALVAKRGPGVTVTGAGHDHVVGSEWCVGDVAMATTDDQLMLVRSASYGAGDGRRATVHEGCFACCGELQLRWR